MRYGAPKVLIDGNRPRGACNSALFSPDGIFIATCSDDGMVRIWDARRGQLMRRVKSHYGLASEVVFMPDGKGLVTRGSAILRYWDLSSLYTRIRARSRTVGDSRLLPGVQEQTRPEREFSAHEVRLFCSKVSYGSLLLPSFTGYSCLCLHLDRRRVARFCLVRSQCPYLGHFQRDNAMHSQARCRSIENCF
jgi:WD40 repeat protein